MAYIEALETTACAICRQPTKGRCKHCRIPVCARVDRDTLRFECRLKHENGACYEAAHAQ